MLEFESESRPDAIEIYLIMKQKNMLNIDKNIEEWLQK